MAGNGGMQKTYDEQYETDLTDLTMGGNRQLVNGDEDDVIGACYEKMEARTGTLSSEDDSHVQGIYREPDFAGS